MKELTRIKIAHLPTPLEPMERLSQELGGPQLWVKRDDQTGLAFGGNKARKLEFLMADACEQGARTLITAGAVQSNHCRQTAAAAAMAGFDCILVLTTSHLPQNFTGNLLLDRLFGAKFVWTDRENREQTLERVFKESKKAGQLPYLIPYGGSNPLGAAAYAYALDELLGQGLHPDWIVFASSSGGTQAGLVVGARKSGYEGGILGISIDEPAETLRMRVADLASQTSTLFGEKMSFSPEEITVNADYLGGGYGVIGALEKDAIQLFARTEGLLLDPVYTGRAAGGLVDLVRQGFFDEEASVLFWHTGGTPALFADTYQELGV
jgi:D-cysteine desulfhydrase family pyridoxal phosphate-dependent enzyme